MSCRCISYNRPDLRPRRGKPEVMLRAPTWSVRPIICVDACIADAIQMLWRHDVITRGCCCGHNRIPPSVVLDMPDQAPLAIELLQKHDGREWDVLVWTLCKIAPDGTATGYTKTFAPTVGATRENGEPVRSERNARVKSSAPAPISPVPSRPAAAGKREPRGRRSSVGCSAPTQGVKKPGRNFKD